MRELYLPVAPETRVGIWRPGTGIAPTSAIRAFLNTPGHIDVQIRGKYGRFGDGKEFYIAQASLTYDEVRRLRDALEEALFEEDEG